MSTGHTATNGRGVFQSYPECPEIAGTELDSVFRRLWDTLCEVPPEEMVRREKAAARVAAEAAAYAKERETKGARRGQGAHSRFRTAFTKAMEGAKGLERREVARAVAQATARFLSDHVDGRTIERLTGIYARHELTRCRYEGGRLAAEVEVSPGKVRDPLAVLNYRCGEGVAA